MAVFKQLPPEFEGGLFRTLPKRQSSAADRQVFAGQIRIGIDGHSTDEHLAVFRPRFIQRSSGLRSDNGMGSERSTLPYTIIRSTGELRQKSV